MKIGIISDTHGKLHPPVLELIASCDVVLHVGDVDNSQTLDQLWMHLKPNAPFYLGPSYSRIKQMLQYANRSVAYLSKRF